MLLRNVCLEGVAYELPPYVMTTDAIFEELAPMLERLKIPPEGVINASGVEERRLWAPGTRIVDRADDERLPGAEEQTSRESLEES